MEDLKGILKKETNEKINDLLVEANKKINEIMLKSILDCNNLIVNDIGVNNIKVHHYGDFNGIVNRYISLEEYKQFTKLEIENFKKYDEVSFNFLVNDKVYEIPDYYGNGLELDANDVSYSSFMKLLGFEDWIGM